MNQLMETFSAWFNSFYSPSITQASSWAPCNGLTMCSRVLFRQASAQWALFPSFDQSHGDLWPFIWRGHQPREKLRVFSSRSGKWKKMVSFPQDTHTHTFLLACCLPSMSYKPVYDVLAMVLTSAHQMWTWLFLFYAIGPMCTLVTAWHTFNSIMRVFKHI